LPIGLLDHDTQILVLYNNNIQIPRAHRPTKRL
jgi:hypothetical protein